MTGTFDLLANRFRHPFDGFGFHHHIGKFFQIPPAFVEGFLPSDPSHHAPHTGAERTVHNVQVLVFRNPALTADGAMIVGALDLHRRQHGDQILAPIGDKLGLMALSALDLTSSISSSVGIQKFLQNTSAHLLHRRPNGFLAGFQVHMPPLLPAPQNSIYGALDFFVDFLPNRLDKVFFKVSSSCLSSISRAGRSRQIFSFTSTSSFVSSTKRW